MQLRFLPLTACAVLCLAHCGEEETPLAPGTGGIGTAGGGLDAGAGGAVDASSDSAPGPASDAAPGPGDFTPTDASGDPDGGGCDNALRLYLRDFTEEHDDFESKGGSVKGLVEPNLGGDLKPVYAHPGSTSVTTGPAEFDQWYRDVPGINMTFEQTITFSEQPVGSGKYVYNNDAFFPLDGMGFGNGPTSLVDAILGTDPAHNFLFTTEAHTRFTYLGGEQFTFKGDDDLWIFINGRLAIDLGGVHGSEEQMVDLDAEADTLGIEVGETYPMDIFHAERHTTESHFRIETTIDLSCIENVEPPDLF